MKWWPLVAILVANGLAAVTLFYAGKWVGETNRYDDCQLVTLSRAIMYLCPVKREPAPVRGHDV